MSDNVVELKRPEETRLCDFCQEQPPICEVDMHIRYEALPNERFRVVIKCCHGCADMLGLDPDDALDVLNNPDSDRVKEKLAAPLHVPQGHECVTCGDPAVILTRDGPMCAAHAFGPMNP